MVKSIGNVSTSLWKRITLREIRSWLILGVAIRHAIGLGLNMQCDSEGLKNDMKEIRYRLWWALYCFEQRLCNMTGRVNCILDEHCTTPLPIPLEEEQFESEEAQRLLSRERQQGERAPSANFQTFSELGLKQSTDSSLLQATINSRSHAMPGVPGDLKWAENAQPNSALYFLHQVQLSRLAHRVFHMLYNHASVRCTWSDIQSKIKQLDNQLEHWYRKLPQAFAFRGEQREHSFRQFRQFRLNLGFFYYSTKITIHRPYMSRVVDETPNQFTKSLESNRGSAVACVEAAMEMLQLIPDEPDAVGLFRVGPWWNILHCIVQAATVGIMEISIRVHHLPKDTEDILGACKKAVHWLHALAEDNQSAKRAWMLCHTMLREAVNKIGREVNDLPRSPPGKPAPLFDVSMADFSIMDHPLTAGAHPPMSLENPAGMYAPSVPHIPISQALTGLDTAVKYEQNASWI